MTVTGGGAACSSGLLTRRAGSWSGAGTRPGCWVTTASIPSISCSRSSRRVRARPPGCWSCWLSTRRRCGSGWSGDRRPRRAAGLPGPVPFAPRAKEALRLAVRESVQLGHRYIGTEHLLLGLLSEGDGVAARALTSLGADLDEARERVTQVLDEQRRQALAPGAAAPLTRGHRLVACRLGAGAERRLEGRGRGRGAALV